MLLTMAIVANMRCCSAIVFDWALAQGDRGFVLISQSLRLLMGVGLETRVKA